MSRDIHAAAFSDIVSREIQEHHANKKAYLLEQDRLSRKPPLHAYSGRRQDLPSFEPSRTDSCTVSRRQLDDDNNDTDSTYGYSDSDGGGSPVSPVGRPSHHASGLQHIRGCLTAIERELAARAASETKNVFGSQNEERPTRLRNSLPTPFIPSSRRPQSPPTIRPSSNLFLPSGSGAPPPRRGPSAFLGDSMAERERAAATETRLQQELVKENVALSREVQHLREETSRLTREKEKLRQELTAQMVEKHERRVRLLKEEFDYKLEEQQTLMQEQTERLAERLRQLEGEHKATEISLQLANEKCKSEERHAAVLAEQNKSLEAQSGAALKTVAQFSEKHTALTKALDEARRVLSTKDATIHRLENSLHQMETDVEAAKSVYIEQQKELAILSQRLAEKSREADAAHDAARGQEAASAALSQQLTVLRQALQQMETQHEEADNEKRDLERLNHTLASQRDMLAQRAEEYLEIAGRCTSESASLRQENLLLRQRLDEQQESLRYYKHLALKQRCVASSKVEARSTTAATTTTEMPEEASCQSQETRSTAAPQSPSLRCDPVGPPLFLGLRNERHPPPACSALHISKHRMGTPRVVDGDQYAPLRRCRRPTERPPGAVCRSRSSDAALLTLPPSSSEQSEDSTNPPAGRGGRDGRLSGSQQPEPPPVPFVERHVKPDEYQRKELPGSNTVRRHTLTERRAWNRDDVTYHPESAHASLGSWPPPSEAGADLPNHPNLVARLVKVLSESGTCRYELQQLEAYPESESAKV